MGQDRTTHAAAWSVIVLLTLLGGAAATGQEQPPGAGAVFRAKLAALAEVRAREDLTAEEKGQFVLVALRSEVQLPVDRPGVPALASGWALTEHLRIAYASLLGELLLPEALWLRMTGTATGPNADPADMAIRKLLLYAFAVSVSSHTNVPVAAAQRDGAVEELARLLEDDAEDFVRALAARSLGLLGATNAKDVLAAALDDAAFRDVAALSDISAPGWDGPQYNVRLEAAMALKRMGFAISHPAAGVWVLTE